MLAEVGAIPVERQRPGLVCAALGWARIVDDPECALVAPEAFAQLRDVLDALHEGV